jgi:hypothetical protein
MVKKKELDSTGQVVSPFVVPETRPELVEPVEPTISVEMGLDTLSFDSDLDDAINTKIVNFLGLDNPLTGPRELLLAFDLLGGVDAVIEVLDRDLFEIKGGDGHTVLGGGDITVSATETDASAITRVYNAVGSIHDINLTAGDATNSQIQTFAVSDVPSESYDKFELETDTGGVTIHSIDVTTSAESGETDFDISGAGVDISGDITVVASEQFAEADADINDSRSDGDTVLGNGNVGSKLTVTASAYYANADLDIEHANGAVGHVEVTASSEEADAVLELWSSAKGLVVDSLTAVANGDEAETEVRLDADGDMTIKGEVNITAEGDNASADVEIHAKAAAGHLYLQGDITVSALTDSANAELEVVDEFDEIDELEWIS